MQKIERLTVEKVSDEGIGIGHITVGNNETREVLIPFTLVGEVVDVEVLRLQKKRFGKICSLVQTSKDRIQPRCKHFGSCGGCSFQHLPYELQSKQKEAYIRKLFHDVVQEETSMHPLIGSPDIWGYRNKMEFTFSQNKAGDKFLGQIIAKSKGRVFQLEECYLPHAWFQETVKQVQKWWASRNLSAYRHANNSGALRTLSLRHGIETSDRLVVLTVSANPDYVVHKDDLKTFVEAVQAVSPNVSVILRLHQILKGKPSEFYEMKLSGNDYFQEKVVLKDREITFQLSPSAFFQPNTRSASAIYRTAIELAELTVDDIVYDLYCGAGIFGMCVSPYVKKVVGIELSPDSYFDATVNKDRLKCDNFFPIKGDVGQVLKNRDFDAPDVVIVDPPRVGLDTVAEAYIASLQPRTLVYVSCNPKTQKENILFFQKHGYVLKHIQPVDQFPHTPHIENIAILHRRTS